MSEKYIGLSEIYADIEDQKGELTRLFRDGQGDSPRYQELSQKVRIEEARFVILQAKDGFRRNGHFTRREYEQAGQSVPIKLSLDDANTAADVLISNGRIGHESVVVTETKGPKGDTLFFLGACVAILSAGFALIGAGLSEMGGGNAQQGIADNPVIQGYGDQRRAIIAPAPPDYPIPIDPISGSGQIYCVKIGEFRQQAVGSGTASDVADSFRVPVDSVENGPCK